MEYLYGLISGLVFFICLGGAFYLGRKQSKPPPTEIDEETIRKAKELQDDFASIMNYDVTQAMQRKQVI